MKSIIQKLFQKNIQYNILSLINVGMGFIFIILLGRKFGASQETDIYFLSLVVINYLGYFVRSVWTAIKQYYIELKIKNGEEAKEIYVALLNNIILVSAVIIGSYFLLSMNFDLMDDKTKSFLNVFIFYLLFQNILAFNKIILNLDHYYASLYLVDIFVYIVNLLVVLFFVQNDIILIAYSTVFSTIVAVFWQWSVIAKENNIKYRLAFYGPVVLQKIYKNSFKLSLGAILYGLKDVATIAVFTSYGSGIYSLYSYASKFVGVITQVVNAPIANLFTANISLVMAKKEYSNVRPLIKGVLLKTLLLYLFSSGVMYYILPYVLKVFFGNKFSPEDITTVQFIFLYLVIYFFVATIEGPFLIVLNLLKKYNFVLFVNVVFSILIGIGYLIVRTFDLDYEYYLIFLILAQLSNAYFYIWKYCVENIRSLRWQ